MGKYNVRCSKEACKRRATFARHPDEYNPPRACEGCGGTRWRIDSWLVKRDTHAESCGCGGYRHWEGAHRGAPHRRGSKLCWYRADGTLRMPGDHDFCDPEYEEHHGTAAPAELVAEETGR